MVLSTLLRVVLGFVALGTLWAQTTPAPGDASTQQPATPAPAPPPAPAGPTNHLKIGKLVFTGLLDGYYSHNFNDPGNEVNVLRNFDTRCCTPTLAMAKLGIDMAPEPFGFHVDVGFGRTLAVIDSSTAGGHRDFNQPWLQAYVSMKPKSWKGVQVDFGKFYTSAGAEVTETNGNWNYSRSFLFALGPYYHTGLRTTVPVGKTFTAGVQVVEGWNGYDGKNHGVTLGLTGSWVPNSKVTWSNNYYVGPEDYFGIKTQRNYFDSVLLVNANSKTSFYVNADVGHDTFSHSLGKAAYYGLAAAARYQFHPHFAFAPRVEVYKDSDGFWTGSKQVIKEFTLTGEYKHSDYFLTRVEFRRDVANHPFFPKGPFSLPIQTQSTFLVGMVIFIR